MEDCLWKTVIYWLSVSKSSPPPLSGNLGKTALRLLEIMSMYYDTSLKTSRIDLSALFSPRPLSRNGNFFFSLSSWVQGVWFLKDALTSSRGLRLLTHRLPTRMLGRLGLFARCTLSHSPCRSLCLFGLYHNSLPPHVSSLKWKFVFFLVSLFFWRIFFPSFLVRGDPIIFVLCPMRTVVRIGKMYGIGFHSVRVRWILCQVPNFICYQLLIIWVSLSIVGW